MKLRTTENLKLWFQVEKQKRLQQREAERLQKKTLKNKEKKARVARERLIKDQNLKRLQELADLIKREQQKPRIVITVSSRWSGHSLADEDLYKTIEELQAAEERGEGRIDWRFWNKLVEQTKALIQ